VVSDDEPTFTTTRRAVATWLCIYP
jgi:hypothetical protein